MSTSWDKSAILQKLMTNNRWLMRAVVAIYEKQTDNERAEDKTVEQNGIGFNAIDANIMSSFARQIQDTGSLSRRQLDIARTKMKKYCGQLSKIANKKL
jgi:hypothetical protein